MSDDDIPRDEVERRARDKRQALKGTLEALQKKLGESTKIEHAVTSAKNAVEKSSAVVKNNAWLFLAGAIVVGVALGARRRRRPLELTSGERVVYVPERAKRSSLFWAVAGFAGKMLLKGIVSAIAAEGASMADHLAERDRRRSAPGPTNDNDVN